MPRMACVLVTGVTGSGKSTTLAAMVDRINSTRAEHIITIEDPIEFLHRDKKGYVNQREIEVDTPSFSAALRASLRQDPDVILVGEMRDVETISTALHAAETGHMVFSTLHTLDAVETINRIIAVFSPPEQKQIRLQLAAVLRAIISQRLVKRSDSEGRVPAVVGSHDQYRLYSGMHPGAGEDARGSRRHFFWGFAVRHADLRPVALGFVPGGASFPTLRHGFRERLPTPTTSNCACRACLRPATFRATPCRPPATPAARVSTSTGGGGARRVWHAGRFRRIHPGSSSGFPPDFPSHDLPLRTSFCTSPLRASFRTSS